MLNGATVSNLIKFLILLTAAMIAACAERDLPRLGRAPNFEAITQDSSRFGAADLIGRISVVDFIFTTCPSICPRMALSMAELQDKFKADGQIQFISFTVDPLNDSLSVMRDYADAIGADRQRWSFLWAPPAEVADICEAGFKLPADNLPYGHSSKFVLIDPAGEIRGYFDGLDEDAMKDLMRAIEKLNRNK